MKKNVLTLLIIFTFSCKSNKITSPINNIELQSNFSNIDLQNNLNTDYSEYTNKNSISSDIEFMPKELYKTSTQSEIPTLQLYFTTTVIFPYYDYKIITTEFINGNDLIIRFEQISDRSLLSTYGPAKSLINLPENINKLILINGKIIDKYSIETNNQEVVISVINNNFTNSLYERTLRYPKNSFAYVCGTNVDNTKLYDEFLNILINDTSLTEFKFDGKGRIPYPENSSGHWVNHPSRYFIYNNTSDFENLGQMLSDFTNQNIIPNSGVSIWLLSWDNRNHRSWIN